MDGAFQVVLVVKNLLANAGRCKRCGFSPWVGKIRWRRVQQLTLVFFPGESHGERNLATVHSQIWLKQLSTGYGYGRQTFKLVGSGHCWSLTSIPCTRMVRPCPAAMSVGNQRLTAAPFSRKCPKSVGASMSRTWGSLPWTQDSLKPMTDGFRGTEGWSICAKLGPTLWYNSCSKEACGTGRGWTLEEPMVLLRKFSFHICFLLSQNNSQ